MVGVRLSYLHLSAPSAGDDLRLKLAIRLHGQTARSDSFWEIGCDFSAATIQLRLRCILRRKMAKSASHCGNSLAISPAIQKIASDCSCDAVVHSDLHLLCSSTISRSFNLSQFLCLCLCQLDIGVAGRLLSPTCRAPWQRHPRHSPGVAVCGVAVSKGLLPTVARGTLWGRLIRVS